VSYENFVFNVFPRITKFRKYSQNAVHVRHFSDISNKFCQRSEIKTCPGADE